MSDLYLWKVEFDSRRMALLPQELPAGIETLDAISARLPQGAYTTLRTFYGGKVLRLDDHFKRLEETAALTGQTLALQSDELRAALRQVLGGERRGGELRLRLTLDLEQTPGTIYISAEPLHLLPPEAYQTGVRAVTVEMNRANPKAKLSRFIERAGPVRRAMPADVNEAIMLDAHGYLLEGLSSNFFGIVAGEVLTAEDGVLAGITRTITLDCVREMGLPLRLEPVQRSQVSSLQEAWITSASRGVLPVRQIDEWVVGDGTPGEHTRRLMAAYEAHIRELVEAI